MATITPIRNLADDNRRVRGPLDRLRGYIRTYVGLEGLVRVLLFVAVWFWLAYALDYGFYRLSAAFFVNGVDWVQVLPFWVRASILGVLAGIIALLVSVQMFTRLFREFSDTALALVLERRFPKLLGDRLITAVELSDPEKAAEYGYSRAMVRETIAEAADRVGALPLGQVFDWKRLRRRGTALLIITVVGYLVAVTGYGLYARLAEARGGLIGMYRFNDVAGILFERNVLLQNTIWPRRAHLEVLEPAAEDHRVGRDAAAPVIRVRAYSWVIADRAKPQGWRALTVKDLKERSDLVVPASDYHLPPEDWQARDDRLGLTVDEIELKLNRIGIRKQPADQAGAARWMFHDGKTFDDNKEKVYRPLLWSDLRRLPLGDLAVPRLSTSWDTAAWPVAAAIGLVGSGTGQASLLAMSTLGARPLLLTVDEVEAAVERAKNAVNKTAVPDDLDVVDFVLGRLNRINNVQSTLERLNERALDPSMSRTLRKLIIPADTTLVYGNWSTSIRKSLTKSVLDEITGNEFTGTFSDLKPGRYDYRVYGEDYATPPRVLTVLPPPALLSLTAEQARPAYLYYRPAPGSDGKELRGLKQPFEEIDISNFGSDVSRLEVPVGTDVRLLALPNEVLREDGVEIKPAKPGDKVPFKDLRVTPWYQLTDKALATLRTGKVPASVVDKLAAWREQFGLEISDRTLSALQEAKAPDAVMDKIKSLKDKAFDRPTLVSLLDRLSPAERDKFQDTVLQHVSKEPKFEHDQFLAELDKLLSPEEKAKYEDTLLKQTSLGDMIAVSFPDVRQDINFTLVFFDQYGVKGSRAIQIKAKEDQPPELNEVMPDVVRKTKDGYIVSVLARVPFRGRVKDDAGLSGLRYAYTLSKIESGPRINVRALFMYAAVPGLAATRCSPVLTAAFYINAQSEGLRPPDTETVGDTVRLPNLPLYLRAVNDKDRVLRDGRREFLPQDTVKELLARKQKLPFRQLLTDLTLKPDPWLNEETMNPGTWKGAEFAPLVSDFALWNLKLKSLDPRAIQPRYKLQLWVEAVDTDLDSDVDKDGKTPRPHLSPSKEKFTFLVVSENELLTEIAKEEEELHIKFEEAYNLVLEGEAKLIRETLELASGAIKAENMGAVANRIDTVDQVLDKQQQKAKEVSVDYDRILQEMLTNQVSAAHLERVRKDIVMPLRNLADSQFSDAHDTLDKLKKELESARVPNPAGFQDSLANARKAGTTARAKVGELKDAMRKILDNMQTVQGINHLIKKLRDIEEQEQAQFDLFRRIQDIIVNELTKDATPLPKKP